MPEASPKGIQKVTITDFNGDPIAGGSGGGPASIADGLDVAQGTTTDVAWVSGAGTVISLLKKIASTGGSAVSIADGADVAEGALADAKVLGDTAGSVSAKLRGINTALAGTLTVGTHAVTGPLTDTQLRASAVPVSGTFWQATQPVSIAAAVDVSDRAGRLLGIVDKGKLWDGTNTAAVTAASALKVDGSAVTQPVSGTFWQATQPVSLAAAVDVSDRAGRILGIVDKTKLWDGTNTAAVTGSSALKVDGSAVTQPVSGTFWQATQPVSGTVTANVGTTGGLALDATLTGGSAQTKITDGTNVATVKAASTAPIAADKALVVTISPNSPGTGGGPVTVADGADVVEGATTDVKVLGDNAGTLSAKLRGINTALAGTLTVGTHAVTGPLTDAQLRATAVPVDVSDRAARLLGIVDKGKVWDGTNITAVKAASTAAIATDPALVVAVSPNNTVAVTGTFWQATQPVSLAAAVDVSDRAGRLLGIVDKGKIWDGTNTAAVKAASTAPIATDPALVVTISPNSPGGGLTDTQLRATPVPVSGPLTDTQLRASAVPVSLASTTITGTVDVSDRAARLLGIVDKGKVWDGTNIATVKAGVVAAAGDNPLVVTLHPSSAATAAQPVTGTFWQATQPVSGPLTDTQLRASAVPVSGTFFQATQPVSIAAAVDVSDRAGRLLGIVDKGKIWDGTNTAAVKAASTAPVATDPALVVAVSPNTPTLPVSLASVPSHAVTNAGTFAVQDSQKVVDNAAFTDGTTPVNPAGYILDEVAGTALTENDAGAARMDSKRAQITVLEDATTRGQRQSVKAASTAAVAADLAAVVALSPNNNIPANALYVKPRQLATYGAGYRSVVATAANTNLLFTFVANTDKQLATIYHAASATKTVRIRKVSVMLLVGGGIGAYQFELRALSAATAPATGNPAITPGKYDPADAAAEATCLALPTTAGSEVAANSPISPNIGWNSTTAAAQTDPARAGEELVLFDARVEGPGKQPTMRAGVAEGFAVVGRCNTAIAINYTVYIEFTEE